MRDDRDDIEWEPQHRRVGLVGRIGCLPLLAAVLVIAVVLVIAGKMLDSPALFQEAPQGWAFPGDPLTTSTEPVEIPSTAGLTASPKPSPRVVRYEAEEAFVRLGKVESDHAGFTGTGFVNYDNVSGSFVEWRFKAARAGRVSMRLRYANGGAGNRSMDILVNGGVTAAKTLFSPTGEWTNWQIKTIDITLNAGPNIIRAVAVSVEGGPNVDYLEIRY
jgi:Carbohydrate binding module (family 35)